jgi:hypothetical protein
MNTGTLISDLMATVERAEMQAALRAEFRSECSAEQRRIFDERELHRIYGLRTEVTQQDRVYMGAA